jgi:hypothetical protein
MKLVIRVTGQWVPVLSMAVSLSHCRSTLVARMGLIDLEIFGR